MCSDNIALPLTNIYNTITRTAVWPMTWKREFVTAIPKTLLPASFNDLRNISCTMLVSKVYESFVLNWAMEEVKVKTNQYGGVKGCSAEHMVIDVWNEVLMGLEDCRAVTLLTSIDYSKAFNRLSFQYCLRSFAEHGVSNGVIKLLAFLTNRQMRVRVGNDWSKERPVHGGVPQGSILGVFLFNVAVDDLEDGADCEAGEWAEMDVVQEEVPEDVSGDPCQVEGCLDRDTGESPPRTSTPG